MQELEPSAGIRRAFRVAVPQLREARVPFLVGGSMAVWALGGPATHNDLDLVIKPADARAACDVLTAAGMREEPAPEEWLFKLWSGDVAVDLIFHPAGIEVTDAVISRAKWISVLAVMAPLMAIEDVLAAQLHALGPHNLDLAPALAAARSVREQIDWARLRVATAGSAFAAAFFTLVEQLEIVGPAAPVESPPIVAVPGRGGGSFDTVTVERIRD